MSTHLRMFDRGALAGVLRGLPTGVILLTVIGCGGEQGPPRQPISGAVKLDGQPLPEGSITFLPEEKGTAATAKLSAGSYSIGQSEGPQPGKYKVAIVAVQPTGKQVPNPDFPKETIEETRNVVPPLYNVRTNLQVEVKSGASNTFDFDLTSREDAAGKKRR